mmetsp:Transcript_20312/g.43956  ORF Transcript_20312/g.43956 Transcript_20312/m.43956 type:complete len:483 (+) Transcript_20312:30-1478(+)|eukprot:CAMPEP_0168808986 /NCGR_PEP_ID=MMETSP0726-20121227/2856_1 /TAXON_ID=265536 /ORGANISM="Amphiprora sp., Strain CCMP467" /LENGTH=482 /DNA_ID=CAMNT_0008860963 /DNA_START=30 /DNA_END=1478 /DNA_ORIENTATION=+
MGNLTSVSSSSSIDDQISKDLLLIGTPNNDDDNADKDETLARQKQQALRRLQRAFVRHDFSVEQRFQACAKVERRRYSPWPQPPRHYPQPDSDVLADRVRGLVYGAALGDAVGLATEFLSKRQVQTFYGDGFDFCPQPTRLYPDTHRIMWMPGDFTDDTDQLLLVMQSLLECLGKFQNAKESDGDNYDVAAPKELSLLSDNDLHQLECDFARRILDWKDQGFPELGDEGGAGLGQHTKRVLTAPEFVQEPSQAAHAIWEQSGRSSASNGALMRTAVTGLAYYWDLPKMQQITSAICRTTHADPKCEASCVAVATIVALLLVQELPTSDNLNSNLDDILRQAHEAAERQLPSGGVEARQELYEWFYSKSTSLEKLNLGDPVGIGYTFKCLGAALWGLRHDTTAATASSQDFCAMIRALTLEGGDADTNATVAGGLWGCRWGFSALPLEWIEQLPHAAWLEAHVQKLLCLLMGHAKPIIAATEP